MSKKIQNFFIKRRIIPRGIVLCFFSFIAALVYNAYVVPNNVVCGGMSGLAIVVNSIYEISPVFYMNVFSIITLILGIIFLGFKETSYGIIGYLVYTLMINITSPIASYVSLDFDSTFLNTLIIGSINGAAFGFIYRTGFNTAGADTIIEIFKKYRHKPIGFLSNVINGVIIAAGLYIFGITKAIYAITFLIISNKVCDFILLGDSMHKLCYIYTKDQEKVLDYISNELKCGYTLLDSTNGIGFLNRKLIFCVIPSDRYLEFKDYILKIDKRGKIYSNDCYTVEGGTIESLLFV